MKKIEISSDYLNEKSPQIQGLRRLEVNYNSSCSFCSNNTNPTCNTTSCKNSFHLRDNATSCEQNLDCESGYYYLNDGSGRDNCENYCAICTNETLCETCEKGFLRE